MPDDKDANKDTGRNVGKNVEKDKWAVSVFRSSPIIRQLSPLTQFFKHLDITPVAQAENATEFEDQYEPRVYLKKQLQTRTHNWHDFFNAMIWLRFSETKKTKA